MNWTKALGEAAQKKIAEQIVAGLWLFMSFVAGIFWTVGKPYFESPQVFAIIKWVLLSLAALLLIMAVVLHYIQFRKQHLETLQENQRLQQEITRMQAAQREEMPQVYVSRYTDDAPDKPSPLAFEILKTLNGAGPQAAITVELLGNLEDLNRDAAIEIVKELREAGYIYTSIPAAGEWNGHYSITPKGRKCVQLHAT